MRLEVRDGHHVRFWHDSWCGDWPLKLCYPVLYTLARFLDAWVRWSSSLECCLYRICSGLGGRNGFFLL